MSGCRWGFSIVITLLVRCPGDFVSVNSASRISIGPAERFGRLGVSADVFAKLVAQIRNRSKDPARDHVSLDLGKPKLDLIQPGGVGWREVKLYVRMFGEETFDIFGLMRRKVVGSLVGRTLRRVDQMEPMTRERVSVAQLLHSVT